MLLPTGMYRARAVVAILTGTSPGTEHVQALFEVVEGEREGQFVPWYGFFTDVTAKQTVGTLRQCGWHGYDLADLDGVKENEVAIEVEHGQLSGRTEARVRWVYHTSRLTDLEPLPPDRARAFADQMRPFILSLKHRPSPAAEDAPARGSDTQRLRVGPDGVPCSSLGDEIVPF